MISFFHYSKQGIKEKRKEEGEQGREKREGKKEKGKNREKEKGKRKTAFTCLHITTYIYSTGYVCKREHTDYNQSPTDNIRVYSLPQ